MLPKSPSTPQASGPRRRIDIHSHLLPGIDDGCADADESIEMVRRLIDAGYGGTICTPHIWPEQFPQNTPDHVDNWTIQLRATLRAASLDYPIWPGGELRLFDGVVLWMKAHRVPTLAGSRCVLVDHWGDRWPTWTTKSLRWLIDEGYQPILAHPERMNPDAPTDEQLGEVAAMGVWMQGNFRALTGANGYHADARVRRFLEEGRYRFMGLDAHDVDTLEERLDGITLMEEEFGREMVDHMTIDAPRELILNAAQTANDA